MSTSFRSVSSLGFLIALVGCSPSSGETSRINGNGNGNPSQPNNGTGGTTVIPNGTGGSGGSDFELNVTTRPDSTVGGTGGSKASDVIRTLPAGFTQADVGGYKLGGPVDSSAGATSGDAGGSGGTFGTAGTFGSSGTFGTGGGGGATSGGASGGGAGGASNGDCGNILLGVVRDFKGADEGGGHPDFEADIGGGKPTPGLVSTTLGSDMKPVYTSMCETGAATSAACPYKAQTSSKANFDQWYHDTAGVNQAFEVSIWLAPQPGGLFTFQSKSYFPLDNAGFKSMKQGHNFGFTTELHTQFLYSGGETFTFNGDDDVWVFINKKLAVDLGGLHPAAELAVVLDTSAAALGITKGNIYSLDLFHAERHTSESNFRIDTNLSFVDCGTVIKEHVK